MGGNEIAIAIHCDAGQILTKNGSKAQIGICGFTRKQITEQTKNDDFRKGVAISWVGVKVREWLLPVLRGGFKRFWFRHGKDVERATVGNSCWKQRGNTHVCKK